MTNQDLQRLAAAVELLTDLLRDDLRRIEKGLYEVQDKSMDTLRWLERIEAKFRKHDEQHEMASEPTQRVRIQSGQFQITGPQQLITAPAQEVERYDDGPSGVTADRHKITFRWDFLVSIWKGVRWVLLFGAGAAVTWLKHYTDRP